MKLKILVSSSVRRLLFCLSAAVLVLALCARASWGQAPANGEPTAAATDAPSDSAPSNSPDPQNPEDTPAPESASAADASAATDSGASSRDFYTLPTAFKKHWLGRLSANVVRDNGLLNGLFPSSSSATYYGGSAAFGYDLPTKRSDYLFDYSASGRYYHQFPQLDKVSQDLGLRQVTELGAHTRSILDYRFSMTPDLGSTLISEGFAQQSSLLDPVSALGGPPAAPVSLGAAQSPADGLLTLRSTQIINSADAILSQQLGLRTNLYFQAGYSRVRYQDNALFGSNQYGASATITQSLTDRTSVGLTYQAGRVDLSPVFSRTWTQQGMLVVTRQIGRSSVLSLAGGPSLVQTRGQETIPLASQVAELLDTPSLNRSGSGSSIGWMGSGAFAFGIRNTGVRVSYQRSVQGSGGLGGASLNQVGAVALERGFGQKTSATAELSYDHLEILGLTNPIRLDQAGFTASLNRRVTRNLNVSTYFVYAKLLRGFNGPTLLDRNSVGVSLTYNLHTPAAPTRM